MEPQVPGSFYSYYLVPADEASCFSVLAFKIRAENVLASSTSAGNSTALTAFRIHNKIEILKYVFSISVILFALRIMLCLSLRGPPLL